MIDSDDEGTAKIAGLDAPPRCATRLRKAGMYERDFRACHGDAELLGWLEELSERTQAQIVAAGRACPDRLLHRKQFIAQMLLTLRFIEAAP